ncbi:hypothetical protein WME78_15955 [Sorangium sp. So ce1097]
MLLEQLAVLVADSPARPMLSSRARSFFQGTSDPSSPTLYDMCHPSSRSVRVLPRLPV